MQRSILPSLVMLSLAATPAVAQIKSITPNAPARAAKPAPLDQKECDRYALTLEEFVRTKDWKRAESRFDWNALYARATNGIPAPDRTRAAFRETADTYFRGDHGLVAGLVESATTGGSFHYLHTFERAGEKNVVFRLTRTGDQVPDYVMVVLESGPDGAAIGIDLETTSEGDLASSRLRRYFLGLSAAATRSLEEKVQGVDKLLVHFEKQLDDADAAYRAGHNKDALGILEALPEDLKSDPSILLDRLNAARALSLDTFRTILERVRAQKPTNPVVERIALDAFLDSRAYSDACSAAHVLDEAVGGDAYLDWVVGMLQDDAGNADAALEACQRAVSRDERLQEAWWTLLSLHVRAGRHEQTLATLEGMNARFEIDFTSIERTPEYQAFFQSESGKAWKNRLARH